MHRLGSRRTESGSAEENPSALATRRVTRRTGKSGLPLQEARHGWHADLVVRRVLSVRGISGVVTRCCRDARVGGGGGSGCWGRRRRSGGWGVIVSRGGGGGGVGGPPASLLSSQVR